MTIARSEIVFVINPKSGTSNQKVLDKLMKLQLGVDYFISESLEAFEQFMTTTAQNYKVIVICGGDGTINSSLKYFASNPKLILAVLPGGSGNGFARELGFKRDIEVLIQQIELGGIEKVDLMKVNGEYSCNAIGLGLDSFVASEFEKHSGRGLKTYIWCTLKALFKYKPIWVNIKLENERIEGKYLSVCIANIRQYGNNAIIAPMADHKDGMLDLVLIKKLPFLLIPILSWRLFSGTLKNSKYIRFIRTRSVSLESNSTYYHIDGEVRKLQDGLQVHIETQIQVINPLKKNKYAGLAHES